MPLEIEVKLKVEGHDEVRGKLRELGAHRKGKVRETNIFFDRADLSLRRNDTGLRVRFTRGEGQERALLTVKGPAAASGLRSREAFDVHVDPPGQILGLLRMLGFERILLFEKDRESWELDGCLVELDTMPAFGTFVEVEGPSEEMVKRVQEKLGLGDVEPERKSYSRMVGEHVERRGERELRFS